MLGKNGNLCHVGTTPLGMAYNYDKKSTLITRHTQKFKVNFLKNDFSRYDDA